MSSSWGFLRVTFNKGLSFRLRCFICRGNEDHRSIMTRRFRSIIRLNRLRIRIVFLSCFFGCVVNNLTLYTAQSRCFGFRAYGSFIYCRVHLWVRCPTVVCTSSSGRRAGCTIRPFLRLLRLTMGATRLLCARNWGPHRSRRQCNDHGNGRGKRRVAYYNHNQRQCRRTGVGSATYKARDRDGRHTPATFPNGPFHVALGSRLERIRPVARGRRGTCRRRGQTRRGLSPRSSNLLCTGRV